MRRAFCSVSLAALALVATLTPAALAAPSDNVEIVDVAGAGAQATFHFEQVVDDDLCVATDVQVQVTVGQQHTPPGPGSGAPTLGVELTRSVCGGAVIFTGRGASTDPAFQLDAGLGGATLRGTVEVSNPASESALVVGLDLSWAPAQALDALNLHQHSQEPGHVVNAHYDGTVRQMTASGELSVGPPFGSDPTIFSGASVAASVWDTSGRRITASRAQPSTPAVSATATSTSCGKWGGYWTWKGGNIGWVWTWVWYPCDGGAWIAS